MISDKYSAIKSDLGFTIELRSSILICYENMERQEVFGMRAALLHIVEAVKAVYIVSE